MFLASTPNSNDAPPQNIALQRAGMLGNAGAPVATPMPGTGMPAPMPSQPMAPGPGVTMPRQPVATPMPMQAPQQNMFGAPGQAQAPAFIPGQVPNVQAPGSIQPGGFAQSPMVQNFLRQRMMGAAYQ